jgi:D-glycero-D-manno-heptose 1,7-bisphosphate phosphatase
MMKVAFLDRDGVINNDLGYTYKIDDFKFVEGCIEALRLLQANDFAIIIVTNQSGIGRGYYSEGDYEALTEWYVQQLAKQDIAITDVYHCPHAPEENCICRKPKAGLFLQALARHPVDLSSSFMVGDKVSDIIAANTAGVKQAYLIGDHPDSGSPSYKNLLECVQMHCEDLMTNNMTAGD